MISVVVPCYNESEVLEALYQRLTSAAESWEEPFEVLLVDDGSDDATWARIEQIHRLDPRWKALRFSRNFGHQTAVSAGLHYASGDAVIVLDADLQDPPEELYRFIAQWRAGSDVIYGVRRHRKENLLKRFCYAAFYRLLSGLSQTAIPVDSGDFCLMDRKVVELLKAMPEHNRFVRGLRAWVGFRQTGLEYERSARCAGFPKYTLPKLIQLATDGILSSSTLPLRLATRLGLLACALGALAAAVSLSERFWGSGQAGSAPSAGVLIAVLFLGGAQLLCLGILGEYVGRIYEDVKGRPLWVLRETLGIESRAISFSRRLAQMPRVEWHSPANNQQRLRRAG